MLHRKNAKLKTFIMSAANLVMRVRFLVLAVAVCAGMLCFYALASPDGQIDTSNGTITCASPLEVVQTDSGDTIINDSSTRILCISPDGTLKYKIDADDSEQFTGITVDNSGDLFMFRTKNSSSAALSDDIYMYDSSGNFVRSLYTISYAAETEENDQTVRTSPLHFEDGCLFFTRYLAYETQLYQIDLTSGNSFVTGTLKSNIPFLYNDVEGHPGGVYYYAKITGEVGSGTLGGNENILYSGDYDIAGDSGFRPFYVRCSGDAVYTYDFWQAAIYEVGDGAISAPDWSADIDYNEAVYELSASQGAVYGISDGVPWVERDGSVTVLPSSASISSLAVANEILIRVVSAVCLPLAIISGLYIVLYIFWRILLRGTHIAWKLLLFEVLIAAGLLAIVYAGISSRYQNYIDQSLSNLQRQAKLTSQLLDGENVTEINDSADFSDSNYAALCRLLVENYGLYESESDTAAVLLVPCGEDQYCIVASNRGYGDILGYSTLLSDFIGGDSSGSAYSKADQTVYAYSATGGGQKPSGYLFLYTTTKNIRSQFLSIWSPYAMAGFFAVLFLLFVFSTAMITKKLKRVTYGIERIANGDFKYRIPESSEDELGTLINCVNDLSRSIENLIDDKVKLTEEVRKSQYEVLSSLASIVENKSGQTAAHVERVSQCVRLIASELGYSGQELEYVSIAAMLHDVGKIFVPAEILDKPGKLTPEEFDVVKRHTSDGEKLLRNAPGTIMKYARTIALEHHEKWDGTGYMGLRGSDIHVEARITAIADVFDALMSRRSYKEAFSAEKTFKIITEESGKHFDPMIVEVFKRCFARLCQIIRDNPDLAA